MSHVSILYRHFRMALQFKWSFSMKKLLLKSGLALLLAASSFTSFATQVPSLTQHHGVEKRYVLRITSLDPSREVAVYGSYMEFAKSFTNLTYIKGQVTPIEVDVKTIGLSTELMAENNVRVEVVEKTAGKDIPVLSGSGTAIVSFNDSNSMQYVYAR